MLAGWEMGSQQPGLAIISNCCFCSSADAPDQQASVNMRPMLNPTRVRWRRRRINHWKAYVTSPARPLTSRQPASTCAQFRRLFSLMVTICAASSHLRRHRQIHLRYRTSSARGAARLSRNSRAVGALSTMMVPFALRSFSPAFASSPASAYCEANAAIFQRR